MAKKIYLNRPGTLNKKVIYNSLKIIFIFTRKQKSLRISDIYTKLEISKKLLKHCFTHSFRKALMYC